jgi:chorismate mutase
MDLKNLFIPELKKPIFIAGPCSAETEEQVLNIANQLKNTEVTIFRSGIWKPRTKPGLFEGVGEVGLGWLQNVKKETGLLTTCEVGNAHHVELALKYGIDILWVGARTTVNPFSVQELADSLKGVNIPIMVKNPMNPDLELWIGAIERFRNLGNDKVAAIHRGFSSHTKNHYRNPPFWEIPIELMRRFPELTIICDNSHICGNREMLKEVAQFSMDLNFDGLMTEIHDRPDEAWTDSLQQITPSTYLSMIQELEVRTSKTVHVAVNEQLEIIRNQINSIDESLLVLLSDRMNLSNEIGKYKKEHNISILQPERWNFILENALKIGRENGLSDDFIAQFFNAIHSESIKRQRKVYYFQSNLTIK